MGRENRTGMDSFLWAGERSVNYNRKRRRANGGMVQLDSRSESARSGRYPTTDLAGQGRRVGEWESPWADMMVQDRVTNVWTEGADCGCGSEDGSGENELNVWSDWLTKES